MTKEEQGSTLTEAQTSELITKVIKEVVPEIVKEEMKTIKDSQTADVKDAALKSIGFVSGKGVDIAKYKKSIDFINGLMQGGNPKVMADMGFKALNTDSDVNGGFLVPEEFSDMIDEIPLNVGYARLLGQFVPMKSKTRNMPVLENDVSVSWPGEGNNGTESNPTLGNVKLEARTMMGISTLTNELLDDSDVPMLQFLAKRYAQAFALEEDRQFFMGTGAPFQGIATDPNITVVQLASGATFASTTLADLRKLPAALEETILPGCAFFMNKQTLATIESIQEGSRSIVQEWNPVVDGIVAAGKLKPQAKIWGYPVFTTSRLVGTSAGTTRFIFFGNVNYYYFGDRRQRTMKVSDTAVVGSFNSFTANGAAVRLTQSIALAMGLPGAFAALRTN